MKKYKLFVFDFDGTIADSKHNIANSFNLALKNMRLSPVPKKNIYKTIGYLTINNSFKQFYHDLTEQEVKRLAINFRDHLKENAKKEIVIFPHVKNTLKILKEHNLQLAIITTKNSQTIIDILDILELSPLFTVVYGSGMPGGNKPDKGCMEYVWENIDPLISREKTVFIGDTSVDLELANNAHIDSIGVSYGITGKRQINKLGFTYTIDRFDEILKFI